MQQQNLSVQDGMIMRSLVNFPGGLELHIGVRLLPAPFYPIHGSLDTGHSFCLRVKARKWRLLLSFPGGLEQNIGLADAGICGRHLDPS